MTERKVEFAFEGHSCCAFEAQEVTRPQRRDTCFSNQNRGDLWLSPNNGGHSFIFSSSANGLPTEHELSGRGTDSKTNLCCGRITLRCWT